MSDGEEFAAEGPHLKFVEMKVNDAIPVAGALLRDSLVAVLAEHNVPDTDGVASSILASWSDSVVHLAVMIAVAQYDPDLANTMVWSDREADDLQKALTS